jgi:hypothetical protein
MDTSNTSASQEGEIQSDSEGKDALNASCNSDHKGNDASDSLSNLEEDRGKMDGSEAETSDRETTTLNEAQSCNESKDLPGVCGKNETQTAETPVCSQHSEDTSFVKDEESEDTLQKQSKEEGDSIQDKNTDIINNSTASKISDTVNDSNTDEQSNNGPNTINNQNKYADDKNNSPYYIKWISWKGHNTPIVTQNDNGPCPLLAIINVLLLRRTIEFPGMQEMVTTRQLMEYLGDVVLKEIPEVLSSLSISKTDLKVF